MRRSSLKPVRERTREDWSKIIHRYDELIKSERLANERRADHIGLDYYYGILADEFRLSKSYIVKIISSRHSL